MNNSDMNPNNTWIKDTLIQEKCTFSNGVWVCNTTQQNSLNILRRPLEVARNPKNWSTWRKGNYTFFEKKLGEQKEGLQLIDIGAGPQHFKKLTERFKTCAVEFEAVEEINVTCDITKPLPFLSEQFDIVLLSNVLEHVEAPGQLLSECCRVLRPGGTLLATVPFLMGSHQRPYDFYRYTDLMLKELLTSSTFTEIEIIPLGKMLDVVEDASHNFFMPLLRKNRGQGLGNKFRYKSYVLLQKIQLLFIKFLRFVSQDIPTTNEYTQGFGVSCKKPN